MTDVWEYRRGEGRAELRSVDFWGWLDPGGGENCKMDSRPRTGLTFGALGGLGQKLVDDLFHILQEEGRGGASERDVGGTLA